MTAISRPVRRPGIFWGLSSFQILAMFRRGLFYAYLSVYLRYYLDLRVTATTLFAALPMIFMPEGGIAHGNTHPESSVDGGTRASFRRFSYLAAFGLTLAGAILLGSLFFDRHRPSAPGEE